MPGKKINIGPGIQDEESVLTVSQITGAVKRTLEENFGKIDVIGEISNFKAHVSGHWYFTLKDENAQINCTMWRGVNNYVFFSPEDGMKVIVSGMPLSTDNGPLLTNQQLNRWTAIRLSTAQA